MDEETYPSDEPRLRRPSHSDRQHSVLRDVPDPVRPGRATVLPEDRPRCGLKHNVHNDRDQLESHQLRAFHRGAFPVPVPSALDRTASRTRRGRFVALRLSPRRASAREGRLAVRLPLAASFARGQRDRLRPRPLQPRVPRPTLPHRLRPSEAHFAGGREKRATVEQRRQDVALHRRRVPGVFSALVRCAIRPQPFCRRSRLHRAWLFVLELWPQLVDLHAEKSGDSNGHRHEGEEKD